VQGSALCTVQCRAVQCKTVQLAWPTGWAEMLPLVW
jgi:hypothetical protein